MYSLPSVVAKTFPELTTSSPSCARYPVMMGLVPVAVIAVFLTNHVSNYAGEIQHLDDGGCRVVSP